MKNKPIIIIIITIILSIGIAYFLIRPVILSILSSWQNLAQAKANLILVQEKKTVLEEMKNNDDINKVYVISEKYIPIAENAGQLIIDLTAMAQACNLQIKETTLQKTSESTASKPQESDTQTQKPSSTTPAPAETPKEELQKINFTMQLTGNFPDFLNFLKTVESNTRLITISSISAQSQAASDTQPSSFSAQINGSAYYKKDVTLEDSIDNIKISSETLQKFLDLKTYGLPIDIPSESGFGRPNPFESY